MSVVVGEFEAVLRQQIVLARRELAAARQARDEPGARSYAARLGYLMGIAAGHGIAVPEGDGPVEAEVTETVARQVVETVVDRDGV